MDNYLDEKKLCRAIFSAVNRARRRVLRAFGKDAQKILATDFRTDEKSIKNRVAVRQRSVWIGGNANPMTLSRYPHTDQNKILGTRLVKIAGGFYISRADASLPVWATKGKPFVLPRSKALTAVKVASPQNFTARYEAAFEPYLSKFKALSAEEIEKKFQ